MASKNMPMARSSASRPGNTRNTGYGKINGMSSAPKAKYGFKQEVLTKPYVPPAPRSNGGANRSTGTNLLVRASNTANKKVNTSPSVSSGKYGSWSQPVAVNMATGAKSYGVALPLNAKRKK